MHKLLLSVPGLLMLAGCATVDHDSSQLSNRGEQVNNICFVRQIERWTAKGESAFVFSHRSDDYLVTLIGSCPALQSPDSPAYIVTRRSAASRCLNAGDVLRFGNEDEQPSYCNTDRLYRWNEE